MSKLLVLFPGIGYSCDMPLLYYTACKYRAMGYEILKVEFREFSEGMTISEKYEYIKSYILEQFDAVSFTKYDDVVFAEKSMGTAIGMFVENELNIQVTHISYTPVPPAIPYMAKCKVRLAVIGTEDKYIDYREVVKCCKQFEIPYICIEGVGHRLEHVNDTVKSVEELKKIIERC